MKLLAITALFIAGTLAVPASSYPPPPPEYGDGHKGDVGYGGDHGGDHGKDHGKDHGGHYPGDPNYPPPPPPGYHNGGSDKPPTDGDGYPSDGGDDGDDSDGGGHGGDRENDPSDLCPTLLYSNPQCCSASVLNIADLDCEPPRKRPSRKHDFKQICAAQGSDAKCCVLPLLGLGILCTDAIV
ncbi:uncharacterized protein TRIVIDRAFT_222128 [Trichoderma virens Gv29-8]|uniref:Hydrophobin n=2 Tax=Hypocrea virens TaxID=29875 RepID=G9MS02_HYPVG|nr:uncharacterized protein TRIVIDRAFT_222128 [Trichoderma virens Gv29-8]EHK22870.1 hypothetical protein TRIVIDRAFT_222128 [Trichoderma virens Gv29-8]UKZ47922.1 hypothetical protein TrVGV298_002157 [Trichoderma virens]